MATKPKVRGSPRPGKKKSKEKTVKTQRERFIEAARSIGVDELGEEFERLFRRVVPAKRR